MNESYEDDLLEDEGVSLLDILQTLAENARLLVFGPIIVGLIALGVSFTSRPVYVASTSIMTPTQQGGAAAAAMAQLGSLAGMAGMAGMGAGIRNPAEMYVGLIRSRTVADRMIDRFGMMKIKSVKTREDARDILDRITGGKAGKDGLITITVGSSVPQLSAAMANWKAPRMTLPKRALCRILMANLEVVA